MLNHMARAAVALVLTVLFAFAQEGKSLFNGRDLAGWMWSVDPRPPKPSWAVEGGVLRTTPGIGTPPYLLTRESFSDFDLAFVWMAEAGANSGIKYRIQGYWAGAVGVGKLQH